MTHRSSLDTYKALLELHREGLSLEAHSEELKVTGEYRVMVRKGPDLIAMAVCDGAACRISAGNHMERDRLLDVFGYAAIRENSLPAQIGPGAMAIADEMLGAAEMLETARNDYAAYGRTRHYISHGPDGYLLSNGDEPGDLDKIFEELFETQP